MGREIDKRDFSNSKVTAARTEELASHAVESSSRLPADQTVTITSIDPRTGNAAVVSAAASPPEEGNYVVRALSFLEEITPALGLPPSQPVEFQADPHVQRTSSGAVAVNTAQHYKGIKIFQASRKVRFGPDGAIQDTVGHTVTVAEPVEAVPQLLVTDAVQRAAVHVATPTADEVAEIDPFGQPHSPASVDLTGFQPTVISMSEQDPAQLTVLEPGPFAAEIKANLVWFDLSGNLRLGWEVVIALPAHFEVYRTIVDAENGEILYSQNLVTSALGRAQVFRVNPEVAVQETNFPRPLSEYTTQYELPVPASPPLPAAFPDHWIASNQTIGNSVKARHVSSGGPVQGAQDGDVVVFASVGQEDDDQHVLNMFYLSCMLHDVLYMLGFDEAAGNFQADNFGRGGLGSDAVNAVVHPVQISGVASMFTPTDGQPPILNMGLFNPTGRHSALDSSFVFHEFTHGLTNRLVGGPNDEDSLKAPQSRGMGEGWSDYVPCVLNNKTVWGDWLGNNAAGLRMFPYDSDFPDDFGDIGTGRYTQPHNIGEIWAATLMEMTRSVGRVFGLQLVVDALKLTPALPSFLDGRDAILRALDDMLTAGTLSASEHATKRRGVWKAFAKFGMGTGAQANDGPELTGIVANFDLPGDLAPPDP
jgi:extracellular elastinolytic metalloproteinase